MHVLYIVTGTHNPDFTETFTACCTDFLFQSFGHHMSSSLSILLYLASYLSFIRFPDCGSPIVFILAFVTCILHSVLQCYFSLFFFVYSKKGTRAAEPEPEPVGIVFISGLWNRNFIRNTVPGTRK